MKICPKCGYCMDDLDSTCRRCSFSFAEESSSTVQPAQPSLQAPMMPTAGPTCPNCRNPLPSAQARFCPHCRQSVTPLPPTPAMHPGAYGGYRPMPAPPANPWIPLGIGGGISAVIIIAYFILLAASGALSVQEEIKKAIPSGGSAFGSDSGSSYDSSPSGGRYQSLISMPSDSPFRYRGQ